MKLDLRFTIRPLEELWCQIVVALSFLGPIGGDDGICGLDAKTSGYLTDLWKRGFWTGARGDTLLVASQDMIKADKILLKGLGACSDYGVEILGKTVREVGYTLENMRVNDFAIRVPVAKGQDLEYPRYLETTCRRIIDPFLLTHRDEPDFVLKMVMSVDSAFIDGLKSVDRHLKEHFASRADYTLVIDNKEITV